MVLEQDTPAFIHIVNICAKLFEILPTNDRVTAQKSIFSTEERNTNLQILDRHCDNYVKLSASRIHKNEV
jgi:hypothetical protein